MLYKHLKMTARSFPVLWQALWRTELTYIIAWPSRYSALLLMGE